MLYTRKLIVSAICFKGKTISRAKGIPSMGSFEAGESEVFTSYLFFSLNIIAIYVKVQNI